MLQVSSGTRILILGLLSVLPLTLRAQPSLVWSYGAGSNGTEDIRSMAVDDSGNVYGIGNFMYSMDADPGSGIVQLISAGREDILIYKLDSFGNLLWARSIGGTNTDEGYGIVCSNSGSVLITGYFREDSVDFDPGPGIYYMNAGGQPCAYVCKLSAGGNLIWARQFSGVINTEGMAIATDKWGNAISTGFYGGNADFDPGPGLYQLGTTGMYDIYVSKLDSNGNFVWAKTMGSSYDDISNAIVTDSTGTIFMAGKVTNLGGFDTLTVGYGIFVCVMDSAGNYEWVNSICNGSSPDVYDMTLDRYGNIYTTGWFSGALDFDPDTGTYMLAGSVLDVFVSKLNRNGKLVWARKVGGSFPDAGRGIAVDAWGNVQVTGYFTNAADFDPGSSSYVLNGHSTNDIFWLRLDQAGNFASAFSLGGDSVCRGKDIVLDDAGGIYMLGNFSGVTDLDPGTGTSTYTSMGTQDIYTVKLYCNSVVSTVTASVCGSYVAPDGIRYTTSDTFAVVVPSFSGCDSIITVYLTVYAGLDTVYQTGAVLEAISNAPQYQWVDCNNNYAGLFGENSSLFSASTNGSYAVVTIDGSCRDTSDCFIVNIFGLPGESMPPVSLYPNPSPGQFSLSGSPPQAIWIYSLSGSLVWEYTHIPLGGIYDISFLQEGVYIVDIRYSQGSVKQKLILQKE